MAWGCEARTLMEEPVFVEPDGILTNENEVRKYTLYRFWNCPIKFIPKSINQLMRIKRFYERFPGAAMPGMDSVSFRFVLACEYYDAKYNELTAQMAKA